jgi:preprotein translocase subunit YajC
VLRSHLKLLYTTTTNSGTVCTVTNTTKQRITLFLHPSIAIHARAEAVVEELTLTQLVEKALIQYLPKETVIKKSAIVVQSKRK